MRINTNVSAMNAANSLGRVQNAVSSSMEKLSSGFRINHASDDAAGLGIANKLRADGRALSQASRNAEQTNSLLQVAEGATGTIQSILERMKELATQSGSDTVDPAGRQSINAEFTALRSEIDRTVSTTKFEGNTLLDGTFGSTSPQLAASDVTFTGAANSTALAGAYTVSVSSAGIATLNRPSGAVPPTYTVDINHPAGAVSYDSNSGKTSITFGSGNGAITVAGAAANATDVAGLQLSLDAHGFSVTAAVAAAATTGTSSVTGATVTALPSSQASGTLHFAAADASVANTGLAADSHVSAINVGTTALAGGAYHLVVTNTDAAVSGTADLLGGWNKVSGLAVGASQAAGNYSVAISAQNATVSADGAGTAVGGGSALTVGTDAVAGTYKLKMNADGHTAELWRGTTQIGSGVDLSSADFSQDITIGTTGATGAEFTIVGATFSGGSAVSDFSTAIGGTTGVTSTVTGSAALSVTGPGGAVGSALSLASYDGSANIAFSSGGVSFTIDKTAGANSAAVNTAMGSNNIFTVTGEVRTMAMENSSNAVIGSAQDISSFNGSANISFSTGGATPISFTVDKNIGSINNVATQLNAKVLTVTQAHVDVLDASNAVLGSSNVSTAYSSGADVSINNNGYQISFAGTQSGVTDTWADIKSTLNNAASTITASHVAQASASAGTITGNGSVGHSASFMVDASGSYKTSDMIQLDAMDLTVATLGLTTSDLSTAAGARNALTTIDSALSTVSSTLGSIGANQNRIGYAQDNLKTKIANFSAAESVIRDVDMADEMTKFSKNNILAQAGTAMLAQANQAGQSVLRLLQG